MESPKGRKIPTVQRQEGYGGPKRQENTHGAAAGRVQIVGKGGKYPESS